MLKKSHLFLFGHILFKPLICTSYDLQQTTFSNPVSSFSSTIRLQQTIHMKCQALFFPYIIKEITNFVVCCSLVWFLKGFVVFQAP